MMQDTHRSKRNERAQSTTGLTRKFHHEGKKVAKSFRQPVTIESLTQEVTGDFANDGL
jgi:hypothetical protein